MKDTVPWNIREQMARKLESWKKDDQMFVETRAARHVLQCIKTNSCVTVTASSGVGKTFTVRHVALKMADDGYDILPVTNPEDIVKYHNPNKKTLYVIDDLCGTCTLNQTYLDKWKTMHEDITGLLKNDCTKIIASCRLQVYLDEQFKLLRIFTACECNLLSKDKSLSKNEKTLIAKRYLKSNAYKILNYIDLYDFFPLLCRLYKENQTLNVVDFFKKPFSVYEKEIDKFKSEKAYGKYCALALCVIFNNRLRDKWLTDDVNQDIKQIIENTCEACRLNRTTSRLVLQDELNLLTHTFLKKEQGCYRTIHDKLFDFLVFYFGKTQLKQCIITNGDDRLISERFTFKQKAVSDQFYIIVPDKYKKLYIERLFEDWSKGKVVKVFNNDNMKSPEFRNMVLIYLKRLDIQYQKQLASKYDKDFSNVRMNLEFFERIDTPLLNCFALRDINMVEWCCSCGADVNYCSKNGYSLLYIACERGYTDMVAKLVDNKADINMCVDRGISPLYIACKGGYTDIATKLVDNKADINKCTLDGESPLYMACKGGYTDIVTKLVDNEAHINKCTDGESSLHIACRKGYTAIVSKLVDNGADIYMPTIQEESPLYIACKQRFLEIVKILITRGAKDTNWGKGQSPHDVARLCEHDNLIEFIMLNFYSSN